MQFALPSNIAADSGRFPEGDNSVFAPAQTNFMYHQAYALYRQAERTRQLEIDISQYFDFDAASLPPSYDDTNLPFDVAAKEPDHAPNGLHSAHLQAVAPHCRVPIQQLQSGPDPRQDVQRHDYLPVWKRLPTMSRQDVQRMMMQNVGLAGHIVAFGAIWRTIADHGGYANVCYQRIWKPVTTSTGLPLRCPEIMIPNYSGNGQPLRTDSMPCLLGHVFHVIFFGPKRTEEEVKATGWFPYYLVSRRSIAVNQSAIAGQGMSAVMGQMRSPSTLLSSPPGLEPLAAQAGPTVLKPPTQSTKKMSTVFRAIKPLPVRAPYTSDHHLENSSALSVSPKEVVDQSPARGFMSTTMDTKKRKLPPTQGGAPEQTSSSQERFTFIHVPPSEASVGRSSTSRSGSTRSASGSEESTTASSSSRPKKRKLDIRETKDIKPNLAGPGQVKKSESLPKDEQSFESILANLPMEEFLQACADQYSADLMADSTFLSSYSGSGSTWTGPGSDSSQSWSSTQL